MKQNIEEMNLNHKIHINGIHSKQWINTSVIRTDGKFEFREKPMHGNRHAIFELDSDWGDVNYDEFGAVDFPIGAADHLAEYFEEKTSIPKNIAKIGIVLGGLFAGVSILKFLGLKL